MRFVSTLGLAVGLSVFAFHGEARAVRFALGLASDVTPLVLDAERPGGKATQFLLGFRPVLEVETNYWLAFGAYAPFTVLRTGEGAGVSSSGAESVFGLTASGRYPMLRASAPEEVLAYGTLRGGFGTVNGRAGPFLGGAVGAAVTWIETGRGLFLELNLGRLAVGGISEVGEGRGVDRITLGVSFGLVFRLGGDDWRVGRTKKVSTVE